MRVIKHSLVLTVNRSVDHTRETSGFCWSISYPEYDVRHSFRFLKKWARALFLLASPDFLPALIVLFSSRSSYHVAHIFVLWSRAFVCVDKVNSENSSLWFFKGQKWKIVFQSLCINADYRWVWERICRFLFYLCPERNVKSNFWQT